jgi:tetraacyldisaccharide 4'-kinase
MRKVRILLSFILLPLSLVYGIVVYIRNRLFDFNILSSHSFRIPIITIGNITVGGTGKTPHVEYLAGLLKNEFRVATLSRGYKRKSRGFQWADKNSSIDMIGDEPLQIKNKFPDLTVAVDRKRVKGIEKLKEQIRDLDVVLLDDGYQHRKVQANLSILLIDYNHPINKDFLLPLGNLREQVFEKKRANIIIVTKSPPELQPIQRRVMLSKIKPYPYQRVFFTTLDYGETTPVFHPDETEKTNGEGRDFIVDSETTILLVTAIADPKPLKKYLEENVSKKIYSLKFADHRKFSSQDIDKIQKRFNKLEGTKKVIITTEKDGVRLRENTRITTEIKEALYYIPIKVRFLNNRTDDFNQQIIEYVRKNKKHSFLYPQ